MDIITNKNLEHINELTELKEAYRTLMEEHERTKELYNSLLSSEEHLQVLFRSIDDMIFILDTKQRFVKIYGNLVERYGFKTESFLGKTITEVLSLDPGNIHDISFERTVTGENVSYTWEFYIAEDMSCHHITLSPIRNSKAKVIGVIGIGRDISEHKKSLLQLKESKEFSKTLIETTNAIIIKLDKKLRIKLFNHYAEDLTGYSREEILGKTCSETILPLDIYTDKTRSFERWALESLKQENQDINILDYELNFETPILTKLGEERFISWKNSVIIESGKVAGLICFGTDITDHHRAKELEKIVVNNKRIMNETIEYEKLKNEFFSNISHELKTPLNVLLGSIQLIDYNTKNGTIVDDGSRLNKYIGYMKQNCFRLLRLLNNLIDASKMDSGYYEIEPGNWDIVSIVEDIALSIVIYLENRGLSIVFDTDVEELYIACDRDKIERIVLNLLSNAVKFTNPGGKIEVTLSTTEDSVLISVKDDGIGIPKDKLNFIFERFRQVDKSFTRNHEGSGIGLSIVKTLVEMHGGNISVESDYGHGSNFIVRLPKQTINAPLPEATNAYDIDKHSNTKIERINIEFSDIYSHF